ncbi:MAG: ABC transporter permease [Clostridia bacterium]|nr:ABC transporter permease [Clostridia bacterium]
MIKFLHLIKRNVKLFLKDRGMVLTSLITPLILLILFATFLGNVYRDTFKSNLPEGFEVSNKIINGLVGGQLCSSLIAVSCVTVAFCANFLMVLDKVNGARDDLLMSPVKQSTLALGYYAATVISTLVICVIATGASLIYLACTGWFLSFADVMLVLSDVVILTLFGTVLSAIINTFLTSQGQITAVGTIVSAGYGFICGAYMPLSQFGAGVRNTIMFLPGTYGTSLVRNHMMGGVLKEMSSVGFPEEVVKGIKDSVDCNLYFFDKSVSVGVMYAVMLGAIALLVGVYVAINLISFKKIKLLKVKAKSVP